ncbi:tyrosine-type recombinase/integrase [Flectobacillus roseus]|uniref:tyrosine-type recombinase/integrase n=1 Tax=Flectobacillus roseus TaxID=502259 RepID=UPI0024B64582|nr:tyrosine-type recombinase/integrase [Flectobacillus roseus]MDI9872228.1 tyrosine-type recombinase/integrase [Flectobacillus roseus]
MMYSLNFWLRHQNHTTEFGTPIYCRIKINTKTADFFTGLKVNPEHFDKIRQRFLVRKNKNYFVENEHLDNIFEDVKLLIVRNPTLSAKEIKDLYLQKEDLPTLTEIYKMYLEDVIYKKKLKNGTVLKWEGVLSHVSKCFGSETQIDSNSCISLYDYILNHTKSKNNHAVRCVQYFEKALVWAKKKNLVNDFQLDNSSLKRDNKTDFRYLEDYQTKQLIDYKLSGTLEEIRDLFVFICFTGFDYCDLQDFDGTRDVDFDNKRIYWNRGKNSNERILPLFPEARRILKKYDCELPSVTLKTFNSTLKIFSEWLGLRFGLTTKIGRKTAGMWLLNEGVPIEVVQVILGHKDIRTTQRYYARILPKSVFRATAHLV